MSERLAFKSAGAVRKSCLAEMRYDDGPLQARDDNSPFMKFWKLLNDLMRSREQPELFYGEAKDWWAQHQGRF